jgi:hypothetical protein
MRGWGSHLWYRVTGSEVAHFAFRRWDGWMTMCGLLLPKAAPIEPWELRFCGNCGRARRAA